MYFFTALHKVGTYSRIMTIKVKFFYYFYGLEPKPNLALGLQNQAPEPKKKNGSGNTTFKETGLPEPFMKDTYMSLILNL